jgi:hypothetical protein
MCDDQRGNVQSTYSRTIEPIAPDSLARVALLTELSGVYDIQRGIAQPPDEQHPWRNRSSQRCRDCRDSEDMGPVTDGNPTGSLT